MPQVIRDAHESAWFKMVRLKLLSCGLHAQHLLMLFPSKAKSLIDQRLMDIEQQNNLAKTKKFCAWFAHLPPSHFDAPASYLHNLNIPKYRRAFTLARLDVLPSAVLEGRYQKLPREKRLCPCGDGNLETVSHVLLTCPLYKDLRSEIITPLLLSIPGRSSAAAMFYLLADQNIQTTEKVARFIERAMRLRASI